MIKVGDRLPEGKLWELPVEWFAGCPTGADEIEIPRAMLGKRIVVFAVPGAFTRT
jgi:peroxiredoxin